MITAPSVYLKLKSDRSKYKSKNASNVYINDIHKQFEISMPVIRIASTVEMPKTITNSKVELMPSHHADNTPEKIRKEEPLIIDKNNNINKIISVTKTSFNNIESSVEQTFSIIENTNESIDFNQHYKPSDSNQMIEMTDLKQLALKGPVQENNDVIWIDHLEIAKEPNSPVIPVRL